MPNTPRGIRIVGPDLPPRRYLEARAYIDRVREIARANPGQWVEYTAEALIALGYKGKAKTPVISIQTALMKDSPLNVGISAAARNRNLYVKFTPPAEGDDGE